MTRHTFSNASRPEPQSPYDRLRYFGTILLPTNGGVVFTTMRVNGEKFAPQSIDELFALLQQTGVPHNVISEGNVPHPLLGDRLQWKPTVVAHIDRRHPAHIEIIQNLGSQCFQQSVSDTIGTPQWMRLSDGRPLEETALTKVLHGMNASQELFGTAIQIPLTGLDPCERIHLVQFFNSVKQRLGLTRASDVTPTHMTLYGTDKLIRGIKDYQDWLCVNNVIVRRTSDLTIL